MVAMFNFNVLWLAAVAFAASRRIAVTVAALAVLSSEAGAGGESQVMFAFDDHSIPWRDNLQLTLVSAQKHAANPVLRAGPQGAPDHGHAILYGTVLHLGGKFRMWYSGLPDTSFEAWRKSRWRPMCYAESTDGVVWTKPELNLVEIQGSKRNNACLVEGPDDYLTRVDDFISILHEPDDPDPSRRYKCVFIAHLPWKAVRGGIRDVGETPPDIDTTQSRLAMMVSAVSADGLRWKVVGDRPAVNEKLEISGLYRFGGRYYASGQQISPWTWRADGSPIGRAMTVFHSSDFEHWSAAGTLSFARPGQLAATPVPGQQTHMGAGLWNRGNVLVGLYGMWQDGPREKPAGAANLWGTRIDLGLVLSNDGVHFREPVPDFKVIERGQPGEWDDTALLQGHAFANVGERTYLWYSHWDTAGQLRSMHIGLAMLRRDGFGYLALRNKKAGGHCVTGPVQSDRESASLWVNAEGVSEQAPLTVELLDSSDRPLAGYSGADAANLSAAGTRQQIVWPKTGSAELPANGKFVVKVGFSAGSDARLYALYVGDQP